MIDLLKYNLKSAFTQNYYPFVISTNMVRASLYSYVGERELTTNCCRLTFPLSHRMGYIAVTCCTGSGDIYVTVKGVKCSGKVSRATIGWRLPWFRHPPINAPKQLSPNPDRTRGLPARGRVRARARTSIRRNASSARGFIARQKVAWRKACNNSPI